MADYAVTVVDGRVVVQPFGSGLLSPLVAAAESARDDAEAAQAAAEAAADEVQAASAAVAIAASAVYRSNLFDPTAATDGFIVNQATGADQASAGFYLSDFIPVTPGEDYTLTLGVTIAYYETADVADFVSGETGGAFPYTAAMTVTVPADCYFMRVCGRTATNAVTAYMVNPGPDLSDHYIAFGEVIDGDKIKPGTVLDSALAISPRQWLTNPHYLKNMRRAIFARVMGDSGQIKINAYGDSYSDGVSYWVLPVLDALASYTGGRYANTGLGYGGAGWIGFAYSATTGSFKGNVLSFRYSVARTGTWTDSYSGQIYSPDTGAATTTTAGDEYTVVSVSGSNPVCTGVKLVYAGATGAIRYRWNAGSWIDVTLSASAGQHILDLTSVPATATWTLEIEHVSGTFTPCGLLPISAANGVILNKLASSGCPIRDLALADDTAMEASIAMFDPDLVTLGTPINDRIATRTVAQFKADCLTHIQRVRSAAPAADILLFCPAEIIGTFTAPTRMQDYADVMRELAHEQRCAFIDFQMLFGEAYADYANGSDFPALDAPGIHPANPFGTRLFADAFMRALTVS